MTLPRVRSVDQEPIVYKDKGGACRTECMLH